MKNIAYLNLKDINAPYEVELKAALAEIVESGWYLFGENVRLFEKEWSEYCAGLSGRREMHSVACSNGLDALRLVLKAWIEMGRLAVGDEVVVPSNTYIATILAVSDCSLIPVLAEPDAGTFLVTAEGIERVITRKTKAILPVHLYGQSCRMSEILAMAEERGLLVLEDCAQCHGVWRLDEYFRSETHRNFAFSFYPGKNLGALGDSGAVVTSDEELADVMRKIANYGSAKKYQHEHKGLNARMDELQAAVLRIKLPDLDRCNLRRVEIASRFAREIYNPEIILPTVRTASVFHIYPILCKNRNALQKFLTNEGIATQIHYPIPPNRQTAYKEWAADSFPIAETIAATELSLPCNQTMSEEDVTRVIDAVNSFK